MTWDAGQRNRTVAYNLLFHVLQRDAFIVSIARETGGAFAAGETAHGIAAPGVIGTASIARRTLIDISLTDTPCTS